MLNNIPPNESFQHDLKLISAEHAVRHNALAFLCSALSPVRTAAQLPNDVELTTCQWEQVFALACGGLVAPLLYARIQQKELNAYCPTDFVEALQVIHAANQKRNAAYRQILREAIKALNDAGIIPVLLKGAHALAGLMPDHKERIISDIDLLILDDKVSNAKAVLLAAGFFQAMKEHSWVDDSDDINHHHIAPLYHPTLNGYVELHRHPNYSPYYPNLLAECFVPDKLLHGKLDDAVFYYQHTWQRLIYNQIHHYHACFKHEKLDIRHLAEQSALLMELDPTVELTYPIQAVFGKQAVQAQFQFELLQRLFGQAIPYAQIPLNEKQQQQLNQVIAVLLMNSTSVAKSRWRVIWSMLIYGFKQLGNRQWLRRRIFNVDWYRARPQVVRSIIARNIPLNFK